MTYEELGYLDLFEVYRKEHHLVTFDVGRVISEHKERYVVQTPQGEMHAELLGNLRFTATKREDLPLVGDWVAFSPFDEGKALIHAIYPRFSILSRQSIAQSGSTQPIATNVDVALIVQAVDRDFNLNRLERYLTLCHSAKIKALIVLSKIDLIDEVTLNALVDEIRQRIPSVSLFTVSNQTKGYDQLKKQLKKGKTYCLLGSSGVGKSTLLNNLLEKPQMKTGAISSSVNKGKHTTSHRALTIIAGGGILIDNPGMREVGIADTTSGLETTFEVITELARHCRFSNCTHQQEKGCAVLQGIEKGTIDNASYFNFKKIEKEKAHFASNSKERKKKEKQLGKMIKNIQKQRRNPDC
jgi:ribosome biogenesis GTPase